MSKSKRRSGRRSDHDRLLRAEARARRGGGGRRAELQKAVGWPLCALGAVLFAVGFVGSQAGVNVLPFDQHHVISQGGGLLLGITGLVWATR